MWEAGRWRVAANAFPRPNQSPDESKQIEGVLLAELLLHHCPTPVVVNGVLLRLADCFHGWYVVLLCAVPLLEVGRSGFGSV